MNPENRDGGRYNLSTESEVEGTESCARKKTKPQGNSPNKKYGNRSLKNARTHTAKNNIQYEEMLMKRIAQKDQEALGELFQAYSGPLNGFALRMLGDKHHAEEVLQDTFVRIWKYASTYQPERSHPYSWTVTILRRLCIDRLKTKSWKFWNNTNLEAHEHSDHNRIIELNESIERENPQHSTILDKLKELSQEQQRCIELAFYEGLTHEDISERRNIPVGTVKSHIRRGMIRLRKLVSQAK